jgi:hypothetical protein
MLIIQREVKPPNELEIALEAVFDLFHGLLEGHVAALVGLFARAETLGEELVEKIGDAVAEIHCNIQLTIFAAAGAEEIHARVVEVSQLVVGEFEQTESPLFCFFLQVVAKH